MDGPEAAISINTAQNTPFIPKRPIRFYSTSHVPQSESPMSLEDRVENLEKRLEKAEHLLHIAEDMNKLHQELDEIRNNEVTRKLEDFDQRIKKMEVAHAEVIYECEGKIKQTMAAMERALVLSLEGKEEEVKQMRNRLDDIGKPSKDVHERILQLEKETTERFSAMLSTLEDVAKLAKKNEFQLCESHETLKQVEGEQVHLLLLAREQEERQMQVLGLEEEIEALRKAQDEIVEYLRKDGGEDVKETEDVEEAFLRGI